MPILMVIIQLRSTSVLRPEFRPWSAIELLRNAGVSFIKMIFVTEKLMLNKSAVRQKKRGLLTSGQINIRLNMLQSFNVHKNDNVAP